MKVTNRSRALVLTVLAVLVASSCADRDAVARRRWNEAFPLDEFLVEDGVAGSKATVRITDADGAPMPYALLNLNWEEGPAVAVQSDDEGMLEMIFESDMIGQAIEVGVSTLPVGAPLWERRWDEQSQRESGWTIEVTWAHN